MVKKQPVPVPASPKAPKAKAKGKAKAKAAASPKAKTRPMQTAAKSAAQKAPHVVVEVDRSTADPVALCESFAESAEASARGDV